MTKNKTIQNGRFHFYMASASDLQLKNPLLDKGQQVFEADTLLGKLGDGVRRWKELPYASYIHPLTPGNKHIPAGGAADQFLGWDSNGVAKWVSIPLSYFGITATAGEINYLKALTGPVQSQLNGKAPTVHTHTKSQITDFPASLPANGGNADTVDGKHASDLQNYNNLTNKPSSFPPSGHTHTKSQITDFPSSLPADGGTASYSNYLNVNNIAASTNLNNLTTPGFYYCPANATVATLVNSPTVNAFFLIVGKHAGVYQEIVEYVTGNPKRFMRNQYSGTWGSWYRVFTTGNVPTYAEVGAAASGHNHAGVYEPVFSKNNAFNKNFGTAAGTVCQGNDSRLSDARPANGGNADTVDGFHASQTPGSKSTAVVTNSSGYLMAGYINTNVSVENPAIGAVFVQNSAGDGYVRKASLAHLKTALKVGTVYVQAAQPAGLANGDLWFKTITI